MQDVITVTAESPLLDERRIATGSTVTQTELEKIPTARDPWAVLQSTPGVLADRINVGGNESGQQSRYVGPGSTMEHASWSLDGVAITDMAALGSSPAYYDFDAFEEIQVATGGSDSTVGAGGVVVNLVTKRGTNEWRGSSRHYLADDGARSDADSDADRGVVQGHRVDRAVEHGADIGGPIVRDRLWVWGSYGTQQVDRLAFDGLRGSTEIAGGSVKLNAQLGASNSASAFALDSRKTEIGADAGPFRAPETTWNESRRGDRPTTAKIEDVHVFSSNFYVTALYSAVESGTRLAPRGGSERTAFLDAEGRWHDTFVRRESDRPQRQAEGDASLFLTTGEVSHELKVGAGYRAAEARSSSHWGGAGHALSSQYASGTYALLAAARDAAGDATNRYTSAYVQDTMTAGRLTANVGLRYDLQRGELAGRSVDANPVFADLLPAASHGGGSAGFEWESLVPRLGLSYALGLERRTLLRGSYSRYADQLGIDATRHLDPLASPSYVYLLLDDAAAPGRGIGRDDVADRDGDGIVDLGDAVGFGGAYDPAGRGLLQSNGVDASLRPPMTDELLLSAEHSVLPEFVIGLHLTYRRLTGLLENELLVFDGDPYAAENLGGIGRRHTRDDYVPVAVSRPGGVPGGGDYAYTYWQLRSGVGSRGGTFLENGDREQEYRGASLVATKRLADRWMLRGSLTWSDWRWRIPDGELEDPTRFLGGGFDGEPVLQGPDADYEAGRKAGVYVNGVWSYHLNGLYQVAPQRRWGFDVSLSVSGREGYPVPYYERLDLGRRSGIPGFTNVQVVGNDEVRLDDVHLVDAGIEKELTFRDLAVTLGIDCFNVLDAGHVLQRNHRLWVVDSAGSPPPSGGVTEVVGPRLFRVGLRIRFR